MNSTVSVLTVVVVALITHFLTSLHEGRKHKREVAEKLAEHEHEVAAKLSALNSVDREVTQILATQFAAGCFDPETHDQESIDPHFSRSEAGSPLAAPMKIT